MATSVDAITLNDEHRHEITESGLGHVNIDEAEAAFNDLSRQLSNASQNTHETAHTETLDSTANVKDLEKGVDETFDLRDYLTSSNDAHERAGIKHKHVGVTWEDLRVDVMGGMHSKVEPDHLLSYLTRFLIPYKIYVRTFGSTCSSPNV